MGSNSTAIFSEWVKGPGNINTDGLGMVYGGAGPPIVCDTTFRGQTTPSERRQSGLQPEPALPEEHEPLLRFQGRILAPQ